MSEAIPGPDGSGRGRDFSTLTTLWFSLAGLVAVMLVAGCGEQPAPIATTDDSFDARARCEDLIENSFSMLQPDRLGIDADNDTVVALLNEWLQECGGGPAEGTNPASGGGADAGSVPRDIPAIYDRMLPESGYPEVRKELAAARFSNRTGYHIRNALLCKATNDFVLQTAANDLDRTMRLFEHVVRNIALWNPGEPEVPLTLYEVMLYGRGRAEDRAWVLAELLRQLRIDTVILEAGGDTSPQQGRAPWLFGVLLDDDVYLFDMRLGVPVPGPDDAGDRLLVSRPATFAQVMKDAELLSNLGDEAKPYPLRAEQLRQPQVSIIGTGSHWTELMQQLQATLAGARSVIIYDGLEDTDHGQGLVSRVGEFGGDHWSADDLTVWSYPLKQMQKAEETSPASSQSMAMLAMPMRSPVPFQIDKQSGQVHIGQPTGEMKEARTSQLLGKYANAVQAYGLIRLNRNIPPQIQVPQQIRFMHSRAGENAVFWVAVSQYELGNPAAAGESLGGYLNSYRTAATWALPAGDLLARILVDLGQPEAAIPLLTRMQNASNGYGDRSRFLLRRLKAASAADANEPDPENKPAPTPEKPTPEKQPAPDTPAKPSAPDDPDAPPLPVDAEAK